MSPDPYREGQRRRRGRLTSRTGVASGTPAADAHEASSHSRERKWHEQRQAVVAYDRPLTQYGMRVLPT